MILIWIKKHKSAFIGALIGAVAGFLYWKFVGCSSGTCPITSNPLNTIIYGTVFGILIGSSKKKKNE